MEILHPGVYIQEVPSGARPIEGAGTSTAAFIGKTQKGPLDKAKLVTSVPEFEAIYGGFLSDSFLSHAVHQFFNNGGKKTYIVRVAGTGAAAADITIKDRGTPATSAAKTLRIEAANKGAWGNKLDIAITDGTADPDNEFAIRVFLDRSDLVPPLLPLLLETHDNLQMNPSASNFVEKVVPANSKYISVTVVSTNSATKGTSRSGQLPVGNGAKALRLGVVNSGVEIDGVAGTAGTAGTSRSGSGPSISPPADQRKFMINLNGDGAQEVTIPPIPATGADIAAAIQIAVRALTAATPSNQPAYSNFACMFDTTVPTTYLLTSGTTGVGSSVVVTSNTISLPAGTYDFAIEVDGDGPHIVSLTGPFHSGDAIAAAIQSAVWALAPKRAANGPAFAQPSAGPPAIPGFTCMFDTGVGSGNPSLLLTSGTAGLKSSVRVTNAPSENVAGTLKLGLTNTGREIGGSASLRPANSKTPQGFPGDTEYHLGDAVVGVNIDSIPTFGDDGATPGPEQHKEGLSALDTIRDVNIVAIPGIGDADVVASGANYCAQRGDCFFVGDVNMSDDSVEEAQTFMNSLTVKSSYGALYFPWLRMTDPTGSSAQPIAVPASGFVVGMYARIDAKRGVWKAPAGTEANIGGAVGLMADITDAEQDFLNPIGVNVLRQFPASGLVIWGARTLATRADPEYRYVPIRRTAIFLEQSIYNGIQWAVFEPNDEDLWASLRLNIGAFMMLQFRAGAFQGKSSKDAFFVKCDNQTTTQGDIDAGIVNILVGFAPLKPAEFVVLRLTQIVGQQA